jgi:hypothetical protein
MVSKAKSQAACAAKGEVRSPGSADNCAAAGAAHAMFIIKPRSERGPAVLRRKAARNLTLVLAAFAGVRIAHNFFNRSSLAN